MACQVQNPVIDKFCQTLGVEKIDNDSHWQVEFMHNNWRCSISQNDDKLAISVQKPRQNRDCPHYKSDEMFQGLTTSIKVTASREIDVIVREFKRRINWEGLDFYKICFDSEVTSYKNHLDNARKISDDLALACDTPHRQTGQGQYNINPVGPWYSIDKVITIDGDSIRIDLRGMKNVEMVKEIAQVLKKYKKQ